MSTKYSSLKRSLLEERVKIRRSMQILKKREQEIAKMLAEVQLIIKKNPQLQVEGHGKQNGEPPMERGMAL